MKRILLIVSGKDKPGIISRVSGLLYDHGCNLEDVSMTLLEGQFAMMMALCVPGSAGSSEIQKLLGSLKSSLESMECLVIGLKGKAIRREKHGKGCCPYIVTAFGRDRTGIVFGVSKILAALKVNITDLDCRILGRGAKATYAMILEVDAPVRLSPKTLKKRLNFLSKKLGVEIQLRALEPVAF